MTVINTALLHDFIDESREHLDEMESLLLQLGNELGNLDLLNDIFRTMHNIKGASQLTGLDKISRLSHRLEDLLDLLRQGHKQTTPTMVNLLISGRDRIVKLVAELEESQEELSAVDELIDQLDILIEGDEPGVPRTEQVASAATPDQAPISVNSASTSTTEHEEEGDEELFNIFLEHLKENFSLLSKASSQFKQVAVDNQGLQECKHAVKRLKSSANYMGYVELVDLFNAWSAALDDACQAESRGEIVSPGFMDHNLDEFVNRFPLLGDAVDTGSSTIQANASAAAMESEEDITSTVLDVFHEEESRAAKKESDHYRVDSFIDEFRESLDEMEPLLMQLVEDIENQDILNDLSRKMHNIKGAAQLTGLGKVSRLAQRLGDLLELLQEGQIVSDKSIIEVLVTGHVRIVELLSELEESQQEMSSIEELLEQLNVLIEGTASVSPVSGMTDKDQKSADIVAEANNQSASVADPESVPAPSGVTLAALDFEEEHDQELFGIFIEHLREYFASIISYIEQLKDAPDQAEQLENCIDAVNRLQSSANYMGYEKLTLFYEVWKDALEEAQNVITNGEKPALDFMHSYRDELVRIFPQLEHTAEAQNIVIPTNTRTASVATIPETTEQLKVKVNVNESEQNELFDRLNSALDISLQKVSSSEHDTLNEVFDELVSSQMEEKPMVAGKAAVVSKSASAQQQKKEQTQAERRKTGEGSEKKIRKSVRVDAEKIDALMNQVGELVVDRSYFFQLFNEMRELQQHLKETIGIDKKNVKLIRAFTYRLSEAISALSRTSNELQEGVMKMRMLPVSHLFNRYPRLVHDLTSNTGKKVDLVLRGEETELDKMIVEELSDPLIHIIRNAIDHGIETTEERVGNGKPEAGKLVLEAYQESNHIVIEVTDDGRGLNPEKIKQKAVSKELYSYNEIERLSNRELVNLILVPGFSTAEKVTGTSGRGVGMDVVKKNIEKLNGTLDIDSRLGKGTLMRLKIPLTLAIIHALMVRVGSDMFTIPLANVDETVRISQDDTSMVEGVEVIYLRGVALPIFRLSSLFKVAADHDVDKSFVVIVNTDGQRIGFVVDELLGQQEVVIKPLEDYVQEKSGFSGATIVGDGRISLILDVYELVKMTANRQIRRHKQQAEMLKLTKQKTSGKSGTMNDRLH